MNKFALLLLKALQVSILALVTWGLLPVVWLGSQLYGRPPNVLHIRTQASRYLHYTWTADLENDPPYPTGARIWLTLCIVEKCFMSRLVGLAWLLDQVLYGKQLQQMDVHNPFFVISGGRSGSTQLTRYLEQDADSFVAPSILMCMFPYLWLWRLVPKTIGRFVTPDQVREFLCQMVPKESLERHEMDPFQADTFDGAFLSHHLNAMSLNLGTTVGTMEFNLAEFAPHNRSLVEQDYVAFIDGIARKTLLHQWHR
ncbi:expressed unknown protein [Seminavis robusta]|uniref:Uncharacterized protein n=1 Tax=Seminavis robusta TaxID=568900 RepID=A0A9N8ERH7_9STRA|nr:expressed unknown protein [Seminavis robusta]|eukprot:Sro1748_g295160.1 n/a (255) ;mRNA; r:18169-18933